MTDNAPLSLSQARGKDVQIRRLRGELEDVRAELEELRGQHGRLLETLSTLTVSATGADGTELGCVRLLDELVRPLAEAEGRIAIPAPTERPTTAPAIWRAWLAQPHRQRGRQR